MQWGGCRRLASGCQAAAVRARACAAICCIWQRAAGAGGGAGVVGGDGVEGRSGCVVCSFEVALMHVDIRRW